MFMTGTDFSLECASASPPGFSSARGGKIVKVLPQCNMTIAHMKEILQYYWNISDEILEDSEVVVKLQRFCGRPLLFVDGVFKPMCDEFMKNQRRFYFLKKFSWKS